MQRLTLAAVSLALLSTTAAGAQRGDRPAPVASPEVDAGRTITFRLRAPEADSVTLTASDIPGVGFQGGALTQNADGVWETTVGPVPAGSYRYAFAVDGVRVLDPVNTAISESDAASWSLVAVPGAEVMETRQVPHGAVAEVTYYSEPLRRFRRLHVYTPPGYEGGDGTYPVFYLLHGAGDSDDSWSTVGRAGFILDNLIADGRAQPMVVVMPAGHARRAGAGDGREGDAFALDFVDAVVPHVEGHYRVRRDRAGRAIAGLSMGGGQTLDIAFTRPEDFAYVGVFSSGIFGIDRDQGQSWTAAHREALSDASVREGLRLVWFATGTDDFLLDTSRATVALLREQGFDVTYEETDGGHTWLNWRDYLVAFTPQLFR